MSIHPTLRYDDANAAIAFLTSALGFVASHVDTADDGSVAHAELTFGDGVHMLGSRATPPGPFDTGRDVTYLVLDGADAVDAHHEKALAAGAEILHGPVDQPYGSREYAAVDPEGNVWSIGTYRPTVPS